MEAAILASLYFTLAFGAPEPPVAYVQASGHASLRAAPRQNAKVLARLPRDTEVRVIGGNEIDAHGSRWIRVEVGDQIGYIDEWLLLPLHAAPMDCRDLRGWAERIGYTGPRTRQTDPCPTQRPNCGRTWRTPLLGGGYFEMRFEQFVYRQILFLPGMSPEQAWTGARHCFRSNPDLQQLALPVFSEKVPSLGPRVYAIGAPHLRGWSFPVGRRGCFGVVAVAPAGSDSTVTFERGGCPEAFEVNGAVGPSEEIPPTHTEGAPFFRGL